VVINFADGAGETLAVSIKTRGRTRKKRICHSVVLNKSEVPPSIKHLSKLATAKILYKFGSFGVYTVKP
jgi:hypothetical protein